MCRYRLLPSPAQVAVLRDHCGHARYVWNLAVEQQVRRLNRNTGQVWVPKAGWVRFRWSRAAPGGVKSYRVTRDRAGRWHLAFAAIPEPIPPPGNGEARNIAAGHAVTAQGGDGVTRPMNREPQLLLPSA